MESLRRDLRYGIKTLRRRPMITIAAILCLGLGIGATTVVFSLFNGVLLNPLPYRDSEEIFVVKLDLGKGPIAATSGKEFEDLEKLTDIFESVGGMIGWSYNVTDIEPPQRVSTGRVSATAFEVLGISPELGRIYTTEEQNRGESLLVLSHGLWQSAFGGDPDILGRTVSLSRIPFTVIGVMPADFQPMPPVAKMWVPLIPNPAIRRNLRGVMVLARLKKGLSKEQAEIGLKVAKERFSAEYPEIYPGEWGIHLQPLRDSVVGNVGGRLRAFMGAVLLVLGIACANVAHLLLAQATAREKEMALRAAFGASRGKLIRQMLTESTILAAAGGILGLGLSYAGLAVVKRLQLGAIPRLNEVEINFETLIFAFAVALATGVVFGTIPALKVSSTRLTSALREGGKTSSGSGRHPVRNGLVIAEVALAVVVLIGTVLMMRSYQQLQKVDPGFDTSDLTSMQVLLPRPAYVKPPDRVIFYNNFHRLLQSLPGVESTAVLSYPPFGPLALAGTLETDGQDPNEPGPNVSWNMVDPAAFDTMKIPLLDGRLFTNRDDAEGLPVVIVDEATANRLWPDDKPIGKRLLLKGSPFEVWREVVGVVGNIKQRTLSDSTTQVYVPYPQHPNPVLGVIIRSKLGTKAVVDSVRAAVATIDPALPVGRVAAIDELLATAMSGPRFNVVLFTIFGGISFLLAAVGIYGILSSSVAERTTEIGVRRALGARTGDVLRLVLGQGMTLTVIGLVIGLAIAWLLTQIISNTLSQLVFGIGLYDALSYFLVVVFLAVIALLGSLIPARRAIRVDPMVALRDE